MLRRPCRVQVGRLGRFLFPAGRYVYTGSARRNLAARVRRHQGRRKRRHWHIDYLLGHPAARVVAVRVSAVAECRLNQRRRGRVIAAGFGASDCRAGCGSHLKFLGPAAATK